MMHVFHVGEPLRIKMIHLNHSFPPTRPDDLYFQQQYSPMVMRKFRKSLDNGAPPNGGDADDPPSSAVNSPRAPRKSKGPSLPEGLNDGAVEGQGGLYLLYYYYLLIIKNK